MWEYCAKSELHPRSGLDALKGHDSILPLVLLLCMALSSGHFWEPSKQPVTLRAPVAEPGSLPNSSLIRGFNSLFQLQAEFGDYGHTTSDKPLVGTLLA